MVVFVPAASAAITPTLTLDQSAGTQAGSKVALGTDITFAPSSPTTDSVKDLTEILPPGLLSSASLGNGVCLQTPPPSIGLPATTCKIGSGQAFVRVNDVLDTTQPLSLYLVAPPTPSDLAGIAIYLNNTKAQLGSTGDVTVRPSGDPAGVGVDITFTNIPQSVSFGGPSVALSVKELKTTINRLRMPTSCPSPGANYTVTANSYSDDTLKTTSAPLQVTGCSALKINPTFTVTATRDTADPGVEVTTDLKQPDTADQATSRTVVLMLPPKVLGANVGAVLSGGLLCTDPSFASCKTIGTVLTRSPLYPSALTGKAYLTGSLTAPAIALVFPPPFPITLSGAVDLATGSTTFQGVPDLPLTDLQVVLTGGPNSVFTPSCNPPSGTASATLTSQNGDQTATAQAPFTVSHCPPPTGSGPPPTGSGGGPKPPPPPHAQAGAPRLKSLSLRRRGHDRFGLRVGLVAGSNAPGLTSVSIALPARLRFTGKSGHRPRLRRLVSSGGAGVASVKVVHRRLLIVLRHPAENVNISVRGLTVLGVGRSAARRHFRRLRVGVSVVDAAGSTTHFKPRLFHVRVG